MLRAVPQSSMATVAVSAAAVTLLVGLRRWLPRIPAALVVVAGGIAASAWLDLSGLGVKIVGDIPAGLPLYVRPDFRLWEVLWPAALAVALMSFTETIASGRAFAGPSDARPPANAELAATGLGNLLGGLFGAMPSGGGASQTLISRRAGARSQLTGLVVGAAGLATALFLAPAVSHLPQAVLAAIVVVYSAELLRYAEFRAVYAVRNTELVWAISAFAGVLVLGTLRGILLAVVVSFVALAQQSSSPAVYEVVHKRGTSVFRRRSSDHPDDERYPGLLMVRLEGRLFFGNAQRVLDLVAPMARAEGARVIVLDCRAIFDIEYTAVKMLGEAEARVRESGAELWLAALNPEARRVVERSPLGGALGRDRMFADLGQAVARYQSRQDPAGPT
jgi:MFS superfamily sulfate permease-like transporter